MKPSAPADMHHDMASPVSGVNGVQDGARNTKVNSIVGHAGENAVSASKAAGRPLRAAAPAGPRGTSRGRPRQAEHITGKTDIESACVGSREEANWVDRVVAVLSDRD